MAALRSPTKIERNRRHDLLRSRGIRQLHHERLRHLQPLSGAYHQLLPGASPTPCSNQNSYHLYPGAGIPGQAMPAAICPQPFAECQQFIKLHQGLVKRKVALLLNCYCILAQQVMYLFGAGSAAYGQPAELGVTTAGQCMIQGQRITQIWCSILLVSVCSGSSGRWITAARRWAMLLSKTCQLIPNWHQKN